LGKKLLSNIVIAPDFDTLSRQAAEFVSKYLIKLAKTKNRVSVVLAGGKTPRGLYEHLATNEVQMRVPWRKIHLFWGDERWVSPQHKESNYRLVYEALISKIPIPSENVHPMVTETIDLPKAADAYERKLRGFFGSTRSKWPRFDLVILGVGIDGHTASLFQGQSVLKEKKRWVAAIYVEKVRSYRLTLTLPVFNHAAQVIFVAAGREKAAVLKEGIGTPHSRPRFPYQLIKPHRGRTIFFLEMAAASLIGQPKETQR
jgi:6-phosphogluconolactonase